MRMLKIVFMGTPKFAVPILEGLIENYKVVGVVSQPDKEVGRHHKLQKTPIKELAESYDIPVFQPEKIKNDNEQIKTWKPDLIVTCAYGQIIPDKILTCAKYGAINVHASLLPKLRGGAPIHKAIMYGYPETGITIMRMVKKMDAGDILTQKSTIITQDDNLESLSDRLSKIGKELLLDTIPDLIAGKIKTIPQDESEVTYAYNVTREEEHLDFEHETTLELWNHIRALDPEIGAYAMLDGNIVKIYKCYRTDSFYTSKKNGEISRIYKDGFGVSTRDGEIVITEFQPAGKKKMKVKDYFNGTDANELLGKVFE